jgi:thiol-disulfide isomerase/thioredoxin
MIMRFLKTAVALALVVLVSTVSAAVAGDIRAFDQAAFEKAKAEGKTILVTVHADWCPVCKRMKPVEDALLSDPANKDVVAFVVDFDRQTDVVKALRVQKQATQVVFKGANEVGRHSFVTDKTAMQALLDRAKT